MAPRRRIIANMEPRTPQLVRQPRPQPPVPSPQTPASPVPSGPTPGGAVAPEEPAQQLTQAQQEQQDRVAYLQGLMPKKKPRRWPKRLAWALAILLVIAGGAAAGWWFVLRDGKSGDSQTSQAAGGNAVQSAQPDQAGQDNSPDKAVVTKQYESSNFGLALEYPQSWTLSDATTGLTITSPSMQLPAAAGGKQTGKIIFSIQSKSTALTGFGKGNATAVQDSEKISYKQPSQTQRAQTYVSFLSYAGASHGGLDAIYVTGDNGYQKDQAIPEVDVAKGDPHIMVGFQDDKGQPLTVTAEAWQSATIKTPVKTILTSIVVQ